MKALKVCAYIGALAVSIWFYVKSDQLVKKMEAVNEPAAGPQFLGDSAPAAITEPATPAKSTEPTEPEVPVAASELPADSAPEPTKLEPPAPVTGFAPTNRQTTGPRYTNANLIPAGTPPPRPVDTSEPHVIIDVGTSGRLNLGEALRDKRLNCTQLSPGRLSCAQ